MTKYKNNQHLTVMALLVSKPGKEEILREALLEQIIKIYEEPGYIQFDLHQSIDDPSIFMLYEFWTDAKALQTHFEQDYTKKLVSQLDELLAAPLKAWHLTKIEPVV